MEEGYYKKGYDIHLSDRAAREGRAYATRLFSEERTLAQRYRKRS